MVLFSDIGIKGFLKWWLNIAVKTLAAVEFDRAVSGLSNQHKW